MQVPRVVMCCASQEIGGEAHLPKRADTLVEYRQLVPTLFMRNECRIYVSSKCEMIGVFCWEPKYLSHDKGLTVFSWQRAILCVGKFEMYIPSKTLA
jgi:hypothetical protein